MLTICNSIELLLLWICPRATYIGFSREEVQSQVETGIERPWVKDTGAWSRFFENTKYNTNTKSQELSHASLRLKRRLL